VNAEDSNDFDTVSGSYFISEFAIDDQDKRSWHLTSWNEFGCFLKLKTLLVHKVRFVGEDAVRI